MTSFSVIGLGMAALDILLRGSQLPTWEHGVRFDETAIEGGGPVATAIVAAQRLGAPASMICTYGSDRLGQIKLQTLTEYSVDTSHALRRESAENQVVVVCVNAATGERMFSGVNVPGSQPIAEAELDRSFIAQASWLHLDGFHSEAGLQAARWMHAAGKRVMVDGSATRGPISPGMQALVREADVLICGQGFGPALTGCSDLWQAGAAILELGPSIVVQTEGADGSYTVTRAEQFHTPAFDVQVVDTTGAGDVFHGAFLVGMLHGWPVRQAVQFSTAVSAIKCTRFSGRRGIPTFDQAMAFLAERN
jgi:ribokinase